MNGWIFIELHQFKDHPKFVTILTSWTSWLLNRPQMHEYNELHENNCIPLSLESISATSASFDRIRQAYLMLDRSHHGAVERGFRKKITCSPTIPSTFTLNIGTIPATPAAASCLFWVYSHSSKRLKILSVNSLCNSTFFVDCQVNIVVFACRLDHDIEANLLFYEPPPYTHSSANRMSSALLLLSSSP